MIELHQKPCDVCGASQNELLWTTTWPEHRYPGVFSMRRCSGCGLLFNSPRLDETQLGELYGRSYYFFNRRDERELARIVPMYQRTVALVAERIKDKRILDIGTGRGYLPAVLKRLGWDSHGVEISSDAANYARDRFELEVFTGTIEQYAQSNMKQTFPLVTAIDVIEHVPSPRSFVQAIAHVTEPGGRIILDTPNAAARNIQARHVEWPGFNPFHIYLFTIQNLSMLLEQHGFTIERAFSYHNIPQHLGATDLIRRALKRIGLAAPAARVYFRLKGVGASNGAVEPHLQRAVEQIRSSPSWDQSVDAQAPLASDHSGDNIVVIAVKQ